MLTETSLPSTEEAYTETRKEGGERAPRKEQPHVKQTYPTHLETKVEPIFDPSTYFLQGRGLFLPYVGEELYGLSREVCPKTRYLESHTTPTSCNIPPSLTPNKTYYTLPWPKSPPTHENT